MAQFDVYEVDGGGLVVDCQSNFVARLRTRLVVPLLTAAEGPAPLPRLNPEVKVNGTILVFYADLAGAVPLSDLGRPVGTLAEDRDTIIDALDLLITGF